MASRCETEVERGDAVLSAAFCDIDAICRRSEHATGHQYLLRALCLRVLGDDGAAGLDLARAMQADGADLDILAELPVGDARVARAILTHPRSGDDLAARAAERLVALEGIALSAERTRAGVHAILACPSGLTPTLSLDGVPVALDTATLRRWAGHVDIRHLWLDVAPADPVTVAASAGNHAVAESLPPAAMVCRPLRSDADVVSVIVPVYGGRAATRDCLAALAAQRSSRPLDVIVVDDASPDPGLVGDVIDLCTERGWRLVRNAVNLGFAGAVNVAAGMARGAHLLLLNADAVLPDRAIDRLLRAAERPGVGTVVPFSNDGGFTSFPRMRAANPMPDADEAARIDAACLDEGDAPIDIPAGTAFCMLVKRACWDAVGGLDLGYRRGYFEDVDLCLRAQRSGFRNVLAPSVYVRHVGGQSFGPAKNNLAAGNARLLVERFPDYDDSWMPFAEADPLRPVRCRIEQRLPPRGPVRLIVGSGVAMPGGPGDRARDLRVWADRAGPYHLRAGDGAPPQSLAFASGEAHRFAAYLRALDKAEGVLDDPCGALLDILEAVVDDSVPVTLILSGPRSFSRIAELLPRDSASFHRITEQGFVGRPTDPCSGLVARARPLPIDAMGRAALGQPTVPLPRPAPQAGRPVRVAALAPRLDVRTARFCHALDRRLKAHGGTLVVFGAGLGLHAGPAATGAMDEADYPAALRHRGMSHVLLLDPEVPFGSLERLRLSSALPAAYRDWSAGRHPAALGDLALPHRADDAAAVDAILPWCLGGSSQDGARA